VLSLPNGPATHLGVAAEMARFPRWFDRDSESPTVPEALRPFAEGRHYLSTKQVPSSTMLRHAGSSSVRARREELLRGGYTLQEFTSDADTPVRTLTVHRLVGSIPTASESLAELLKEVDETMDVIHNTDGEHDVDEDFSGSDADVATVGLTPETPGRKIRFREKSRYKIKYEDPWKIHAGNVLGQKVGTFPTTVLWSGDGIRLQDPLPARLLGPLWGGSDKNKQRWSQIADTNVKLHVVYAHTHWGRALKEMCNESNSYYTNWARTLRRRINRFLRGSTDPCLSAEQKKSLFVGEQHPSKKARSDRFIELLKTVDGIFVQRYLAYPEEVWTWSRFDLFTLGNISYLIGDEFLDGEVSEEALTLHTAYSQLKAARKWFKGHAHGGTLEHAMRDLSQVPHWCRQFAGVWKQASTAKEHRRTFLFGLLSQTRGAGTPPPLVLLQSKVKFLSTIRLEAPLKNSFRVLARRAMEEVLDALPAAAFTGLATKARITVTTSASWEHTRREGGTVETARELLSTVPPDETVPIRDLETGAIVSRRLTFRFDTVGECVFWLALDHVLRTPVDDLKVAFLTVVKEPGKARTVTKARACLKIVLDVVNKLCSEPLKKGIRSSQSGMAQANHGWNLFLRLMSDEMRDMLFSTEIREENAYEGYVERTDTFKSLFVSSTDYKEATDQLHHTVAADLGMAWMRKCGIPAILRGIVRRTCFEPRRVYFYASGVLANLGDNAPAMGEGINVVTLRRGVLMGDPLTKVVLHLVNVVTRHIGARIFSPDFYDCLPMGREVQEAVLRGFSQTEPSEDTSG